MIESTSNVVRVLIENPVPWYESQWMLVIWGALVSLIASIVVRLLADHQKNARLKRTIAFDIFTEVVLNRGSSVKILADVDSVLGSFEAALKNNYSSGHPSLRYSGAEVVKEFFEAHKGNLSIFDPSTLLNIHTFYLRQVVFVDACAQKVASQFKDFYQHDSKLTSYQDVINGLNEYRGNIKQLIISADELSARMMLFNRKLLKKTPNGGKESFKNHQKTIRDFIKGLKIDEEFTVERLISEKNIHSATAYLILLTNKSVNTSGLGKFKRVK